MKINTKPKRIKFVKDVKKHLLSIGAILKSENERCADYTLGTCTFHIYEESDHKHCFTIFARFAECNELTGQYNSKHNFHGTDSENGAMVGCQHWIDYLNEIAELEKRSK